MTNAVSLAQQASTGVSQGFKNRIINGAMVIDQRNAGASVTATDSNLYTLDRWQAFAIVSSKYTVQQNAGSVTPPAGFTNYLGVTSLAATSLAAGDYYFIQQIIEGYNVADLGFGTASAKTITASFWVRSSLTGTFSGSIRNSASDRSYPFTYTISSANTWEQKSVTIAGDTTGTWLTTNGGGVKFCFNLGTGSTYSGTANAWAGNNYVATTGSTSVVGTNGATFYITGVQLEVGSTATSFDTRSYTTELQLCQRYYFQIADSYAYFAGKQQSTNQCYFTVQAPVSMRTTPTPTLGAGTKFVFAQSGFSSSTSTAVTLTSISTNYIYMSLLLGGFSGMADNYGAIFRFDATLQFSSEL